MKFSYLLLFISICGFLTSNYVRAQGSDCSSAVSIGVGSSCSNTAFTVGDNGTMALQSCATGTGYTDGWFTFTASSTSTTISISGTDQDLGLIIYQSTCGSASINCSNIASGGNGTQVISTVIGTTYYIQIQRTSANGSGNASNLNLGGNICVFNTPAPPANDDCTGATSLTVNPSTTCTTSSTGTVVAATASSQASSCTSEAGNDDDVWYSFVATSTAHAVTLSGVTGSTTDLDFAIYAASCAGSEILCSQVNTNTASGLTIGVTYFVRVYTATTTANQSTTFTICVTTPPAPPANDECTGAITLSPGASCVYATYNNNNATASAGAPAPGCASYVGSDVWFAITVPANGSLEIDTDDLAGGISDGGMAAYSGACGSLSLLQCNDDGSANGLMPMITLTGLTAGTTIYIRVWEYGGDLTGTFGICVTSPTPPTPPPTPGNDECSGAVALTVNSGATCSSITPGTIAGATASSQANSCGGTDDDDVWYSFVATSTSHTISLLNVNGSTTDLYHSVFAGTCGSIGAPILCSDPNSSQINGLTIGNTYFVRIYSWTSFGGQTTTFDICLGTPPPPPTNVTCALMDPICSGSPIAFTAASNGGTAEPGNDYDCLSTQPNPSWYYLEIDGPGNLVIDITAGSDVDYAIWGPYPDLLDAKADCGTYSTPVDCSYSSSPIEQAVVNSVTTGQVYVLLVTNYANVVQTIFVNEAVSNTASTDCEIVTLPVGLNNFSAVRSGEEVFINWETVTENNSSYFEVQKSGDGQVWQTIKVMAAAGFSTSVVRYNYTDSKPFQGISYYRLKQVDFDGAYAFSSIVSVTDRPNGKIKVFPSPAKNSFSVDAGKMKVTSIQATDLSGRQWNLSFIFENNLYKVDSKNLPSGFYQVKISDGFQTYNAKLVIEK